MMKRLIGLVLISCVGWAVLLIAARTVGTLRPAPITEKLKLTRAGGTAACWRGLCPGQTTVRQAQEFLLHDPTVSVYQYNSYNSSNFPFTYRPCWRIKDMPTRAFWAACMTARYTLDSSINSVSITIPDQSFSLGDAILLYGEPQDAQICHELGVVISRLRFEGNITVETIVPLDRSSEHFSPDLPVNYLYSSAAPFVRNANWRGFSVGACSR